MGGGERERQRQREPLGDAGCLMKGELVKKKKCKCSVAKKKTTTGVCGVFRWTDDDSGSIFAVRKFHALQILSCV